jgi:ABC-type transporter Mla MlaB component
MLKITTADTRSTRTLVVEGKLVEPWVEELEKAWHDSRKACQQRTLVIDLKDVTAINQNGENVLFEMMSEGAKCTNGGVLTKHTLRQLEHKLKTVNKAKE